MPAEQNPVVAVVLAGGDPVDPGLRAMLPADALVVAADSGARQAGRLGLRVDHLVGDLDSLSGAETAATAAAGATVERHPTAKDRTDLDLAMAAAVERGARRLVVVGGHGGRLDHQAGNLLLLASPAWAQVEVDALMGTARVHIVRAGTPRTIHGEPGELVSLLPVHGPARGVRTTGLAWALDGSDLVAGTSRGVSNVFTQANATIATESGVVLAIVPGSGPVGEGGT